MAQEDSIKKMSAQLLKGFATGGVWVTLAGVKLLLPV
jgi:hypothetical protein